MALGGAENEAIGMLSYIVKFTIFVINGRLIKTVDPCHVNAEPHVLIL